MRELVGESEIRQQFLPGRGGGDEEEGGNGEEGADPGMGSGLWAQRTVVGDLESGFSGSMKVELNVRY